MAIETTWKDWDRRPILLGKQNEKNVNQIHVDVSACLRKYPEATFGINVTNAAGISYPAENVTVENGVIVWEITAADTAAPGSGSAQVVMYGENGEIGRTDKATTIVKSSILPDAAPPDVPPNWLDVVNRLQGQIDKLAENAGGDVFIIHADGMRINGAFVASTASKNAAEIRAAVADGKTCLMVDAEGAVLPYIGEVVYQIGKTNPAFARPIPISYRPNKWSFSYLYVEDDAKISTVYDGNIKMPSPEKLTFTGAVSAEYDGSQPMTVKIPTGGGGSAEVEFASDDEFVTAMIENDLMIAVVDDTGVLADENNNILEW